MYVFDVEENKLHKVCLSKIWKKTDYIQNPIFDNNDGIVFNLLSSPIKKLGLNFCLNRPSVLCHIKEPKFKKEEESEVTILNQGEYMAMQPKFSPDFSKLVYIGSKNKFVAHSSNFQLRSFDWPVKSESQSQAIIDYKTGYPKDTDAFSGIFGYQMSFTNSKFIGLSNRFFMFTSEFKGQARIYIADV